MLVVSLNGSEAKVEAVCDEFFELTEKRSMMTHMSGKLIKGTISREECRSQDKEYDHDSGRTVIGSTPIGLSLTL